MDTYSVVLNSDRAHICINDVPVETYLFKVLNNEDGPYNALGMAITKALKLKDKKQQNVNVSIK